MAENRSRKKHVEAADRTYVDKPCLDHVLKPLDLGSKEQERILIIPDTHAPFHDKRAWAAMTAYAKKWRPHRKICLGDFVDFYSVSDHDKDPRRAKNLIEECNVGNDLLDELDDIHTEGDVFCEGNHENRLERFLMRAGNGALLGAVTLAGLLNFEKRKWRHFPYGQHVRVGNLHGVHDVGYSGKNCLQQTAVSLGHNGVFGHSHMMAQLYFGTILGERYTVATCGWLGDLNAANYVKPAQKERWQHGFATALMNKNGDFQLSLVPIVTGKVLHS